MNEVFFMKKLMALFAGILLCAGAAFADSVLTREDFYNPWVVGSWTLEVATNEGDGVETESGHVIIKGNKPESEVILYEEEGDDPEEDTLETFVDDLFEIFGTDGEDQGLDYFRLMGAEITGDLKWHINDAQDLVYMSFGISFEEETMTVSVKMSKDKN